MDDQPGVSTSHVPAIPGVEDLTVIGRGGFGTVYRGRQESFQRDVAVKVLPGDGADASARARWEREVAAMGRMSNHPNILSVYDGGVADDGSAYLVMPYVPDGSLADLLHRQGPVAPERVAAIGAKLAGALASAHAAGVLHRDVKPGNVLVSPYGEPQLTDFGIARLADATMTGQQSLALTLAYAAPEVLSGEPTTEASDVYGLGATLHALLTGEPPFRTEAGEPIAVLVGRISTQPLPDLEAEGVPAALSSVIADALAKDPRQRIPTAEQLQARLDAAAAELGASDATIPMSTVAGGAAAGVADERTRAVTAATERRDQTEVAPAVGVAGVGAAAAGAGGADGPIPWSDPAPARRPPPLGPGPNRGDRGPAAFIAALVVVAAVALVAVLLALSGDDDGDADDVAAGDGTATSEAPPDTEASEATAPPETEPAPQTTQASTTTAGPAQSSTAAELEDTALTYLGRLDDGDTRSAYRMLSPAMQEAQSYEDYEEFWGDVDSVEVVGDPVVDESAKSVTVPVSIDGSREDYRLEFVKGNGPHWLIDGPRPD